MRVKIIRHCDEAMDDRHVIDFVTSVYKEAEGKTLARIHEGDIPIAGAWVELSVGICLADCRASLVSCGVAIGEWDKKRKAFFPHPFAHNCLPWQLE
jgi:hypothetical protein